MMTDSDDAPHSDIQHTSPCHDCPFRREAVPGWLGEDSADKWVKDVHGECRVDCHAIIGPQCAGAAIYRSNVAKRTRDKTNLVLPADRERVFATPIEFLNHHKTIAEGTASRLNNAPSAGPA